MNFDEIFNSFLESEKQLKTISVASCDLEGKPNSAAKMLIDIMQPNLIFFLDYKTTQTCSNIAENPRLSVSFMDDASFTGYRLTGSCEIIHSGKYYDQARKNWDKRVISYETERMISRVRGHYSTKESESRLPQDFVIVKMTAKEGAVIKPDRYFRATSQT